MPAIRRGKQGGINHIDKLYHVVDAIYLPDG
jgi:hypothetical protein